MNLIVCLDNKNGMLFHQRRQSQDRVVREHILQRTADGVLRMNAYSAKQFAAEDRICVDEEFLDNAKEGDYCFVETSDITPYTDAIRQVIVYRWNRDYPHDRVFPLSLDGWTKRSSVEFAGFSHETITEEVYQR
ncbi:MAG: ribonuclease Z [Butyricicoccus sp.]